MKYCTFCGEGLPDDAIFCTKCGRKTVFVQSEAKYPDDAAKRNSTLTSIAKIFMIISCALSGLIALIYTALAILGGAIGFYAFEVESGIDPSIVMGAYIGACIVIAACFTLPLAWAIPMTVHVFKADREGKPLSTAFKVCTLIFVSIIPGILLLCRTEKESA